MTATTRAPLLLFLLTIALYAPCLGGGFVYDDEDLLIGSDRLVNANVRLAFTSDFWGLKAWAWRSLHYRPVAMLTYAGVYRLFGRSPFAYHSTDILLHAAAVLALYYIALGLGLGNSVALAAAALFAVDPLHVEAVAWISGITETLAGAFVLGSLAFLVHRRRAWSLLLAAGGLLSKEVGLVMPGLVFVLTPGSWKERTKAMLPYALLDAIYLVVRAIVLPRPPRGVLLHVLGQGASAMPAVASRYIVTLFAPWPLAIHYVVPGAAMIAVAAVIVLAWGALYRVPGMTQAAALAGLPLLLPVVTSALMAEFVQIQDRYAYLATSGACLAAALLLSRLPRRGLLYACLLLVSLGALGTYLQIQVWQDNESLWTHTLEVTPSSKPAALNLAYTMYVEKRFGEAERVYRAALRYRPTDEELLKCLKIVETEQTKTPAADSERQKTKGKR